MQAELLGYVLVSLFVGVALGYLLMRSRLERARNEVIESRTQLAERSAFAERERELARKSELSVVMFPYKEEHGEDGFFSDERRAEIGYKYQIFVAGVPCFDAHKVPIDVFSKKQVNPEKIQGALEIAFTLVESFAAKHPAFAAFQTASAAADGVRRTLARDPGPVANSEKGRI